MHRSCDNHGCCQSCRCVRLYLVGQISVIINHSSVNNAVWVCYGNHIVRRASIVWQLSCYIDCNITAVRAFCVSVTLIFSTHIRCGCLSDGQYSTDNSHFIISISRHPCNVIFAHIRTFICFSRCGDGKPLYGIIPRQCTSFCQRISEVWVCLFIFPYSIRNRNGNCFPADNRSNLAGHAVIISCHTAFRCERQLIFHRCSYTRHLRFICICNAPCSAYFHT